MKSIPEFTFFAISEGEKKGGVPLEMIKITNI